jgi:amino acid transporter
MAGGAAIAGALIAPGVGLALVAGGSAWSTGSVGPVAILVAALLLLPTAAVLAVLSREMPSAGTVTAWLAAVLSPAAGARAGWLLAAAYTAAAVLGTALFGVSVGAFLSYAGLPWSGYVPYAAGAVGGAILTALLFEGRAARWIAAAVAAWWAQVAVGGALIITILGVQGAAGRITSGPLEPATGGALGGAAIVLGAIALAGFELASVVAWRGSARSSGFDGPGGTVPGPRARRPLPPALAPVAALVGTALFLFLGAWALANTGPTPGTVIWTMPVEAGMAGLLPVAQLFWGDGDVLLVLAAPAAALGLLVAAIAGADRTINALRLAGWPASTPASGPASAARRLLSHHARTRVLVLIALVAALVWPPMLPATTVGDEGTLATVAWWAGATALLVFAVYLAVNAAGLLGFRGRRRSIGLIAAHLLLPVAGLALGAILLLALLAALLGARDSRMGPTVVLFCLAVLAADALTVLWMGGWRPRIARPRVALPRVALPHRGAPDEAPAPAAPADEGAAGGPAATEGETGKKPGRRARRRARATAADAEGAGADAEIAGAGSGGADAGAEPTNQ